MRLPFAPTTAPASSPAITAIYERILARRAPRPLTPLDLALLHSPHIADGWNSFLGAIRTKSSLADDLREIAICRVAVCNEAAYEWMHHAPLAVKAGVGEEALKVLAEKDLSFGGGEESSGLNEKQWAVLRYADESTRVVKVSDETFGIMKKLFSDQEIVEITATVNCPFGCVM